MKFFICYIFTDYVIMAFSLNVNQRIEFLDTLQSFMVSDIDRGIKSGLNYLAALGLSTYIEILGRLCLGSLQSNYQANYIRFIKRCFHCVITSSTINFNIFFLCNLCNRSFQLCYYI